MQFKCNFLFNSFTNIINRKKSTKLLYNIIANECNFSSFPIELTLKNRIEIPPILMRRIINDAIRIFHIMINELKQKQEKKNSKKFQRILKRLNELEIYNKLFDYHC